MKILKVLSVLVAVGLLCAAVASATPSTARDSDPGVVVADADDSAAADDLGDVDGEPADGASEDVDQAEQADEADQDEVEPSDDADQLELGDEDDDVDAQGGDDVVHGGAGNDHLRGGAGNDEEFGDAGNDVVEGDAGSDLLVGGSGHDRLLGGPGNDVLNAADGVRDVVDCGRGRDRAVVDRRDVVRHCESVKRRKK
jgi:Ca2+-binding RTX toxin-like protein